MYYKKPNTFRLHNKTDKRKKPANVRLLHVQRALQHPRVEIPGLHLEVHWSWILSVQDVHPRHQGPQGVADHQRAQPSADEIRQNRRRILHEDIIDIIPIA